MICSRCRGAGWLQKIDWTPVNDGGFLQSAGSGTVEQCPDCKGHGEVDDVPPAPRERGRFVCEVRGRGKPLGRLTKELEAAIGKNIPRHHLQQLARMVARMRCGEPAEVSQRWRDLL